MFGVYSSISGLRIGPLTSADTKIALSSGSRYVSYGSLSEGRDWQISSSEIASSIVSGGCTAEARGVAETSATGRKADPPTAYPKLPLWPRRSRLS
jgi:hypothetical protein